MHPRLIFSHESVVESHYNVSSVSHVDRTTMHANFQRLVDTLQIDILKRRLPLRILHSQTRSLLGG
ncbi:hypothetical protein FOFC_15505 [Fusarium oxysporum]|nr:hypothetical protein FOFC_15505 [Fusarium oxysporum]